MRHHDLVTDHQSDLHHGQEQEDQQRQQESDLDRGLAALPLTPPGHGIRSRMLSSTPSSRRPILFVSEAQATT
ncbi:MAG: hypothetical protein ABW279_12420, partial [Acidimicrobiales bacterium]